MNQNKLESRFPGETLVNQCPAVGYQRVSVCAAVTVTPYARLGKVTTVCCGAPVISACTCDCPGELNGSCCFTVRQELCVEVPVLFGADVDISDPSSVCVPVSDEDCTDCDCPCADESEDEKPSFQQT